jgi:hypothetical protein
VAPMPAPLPMPQVLAGFPPLAAVGGLTISLGGQTVIRTTAGSQTTSSGSETASV